jgi:hypothetical protein
VVAQRATGVVRVGAISLRIWLFRERSKHPAVACGRGFSSLSKEGSLSAEFIRQKLAYAKGRLKV